MAKTRALWKDFLHFEETDPDVSALKQDRLLAERVERLMSIPAIGPITALAWALEIGEMQQFSSIHLGDSRGVSDHSSSAMCDEQDATISTP